MRSSPDLAHGVAEHIHAAGFDSGPPHDCGETELALLWAGLLYRPKAWVFGHFHCAHEAAVGATRFTCVDGDLESLRRRLVLWDTEERKLLTCRLS